MSCDRATRRCKLNHISVCAKTKALDKYRYCFFVSLATVN